MSKNNNLTFESASVRLEEIVKILERGNSSLDESLKLYEEGVKLAKTCLDSLEQTKGKITEIKKTTNTEEDI